MTPETEEIVKILDHICYNGRHTIPQSGYWPGLMVWDFSLFAIVRRGDNFFQSWFSIDNDVGPYRNGFEMLNDLAEYPDIAAKLAEPV